MPEGPVKWEGVLLCVPASLGGWRGPDERRCAHFCPTLVLIKKNDLDVASVQWRRVHLSSSPSPDLHEKTLGLK